MQANEIPIPENWPVIVRRAMIHAVSLAHYAIIYTRSMAANSQIERVRLKGKLDRAENEIALLKEQLGLLRDRFKKIPAKHRPHYSPYERMAILEHRATRDWNLIRTANEFLLDEQTLSGWMKRIDEDGENALVRIPVPMNKYPEFLKHLTQRLKLLSPTLGRKKIVEYFLRSGFNLSASSVRRYLQNPFAGKPGRTGKKMSAENDSGKRIISRHPNHTWHLDLTAVPTASGFWSSWIPNALPQRWPFCWWVAVIIDHFSRKAVGFAVFRKNPTSREITGVLNSAIRRTGKTPKYIITDKGTQFNCVNYKSWCRKKKIKPKYGAVGKYGSIAIVERFIKSMKTEHLCRIMVPLALNDMRYEVGLYMTWYNEHRPHETLLARTPQEVYRGLRSLGEATCNSPPLSKLSFYPKSKTPEFEMDCQYFEGRKYLPVISRRAA
jgi:putative transposase